MSEITNYESAIGNTGIADTGVGVQVMRLNMNIKFAKLAFFGIIVIIILVIVFVGTKKSTFVSKRAREIYHQSANAFQNNNTYSNFRRYVKDADPILYTDLYNLYKSGNLNPEYIQNILNLVQ